MSRSEVTKIEFGTTAAGDSVPLYVLANSSGMEVRVSAWGATIVSINAPDREGTRTDVVLGFDSLEGYFTNAPYFGSTIGRYGNRIGGGRFTLDGQQFALSRNDGENHLHGGTVGFNKRLWVAHAVDESPVPAVEMQYTSAAGEEGYPGALAAKVTFTLTERNELRIDYRAETDAPTIVNLTNHSYFNLAGRGRILDHQLEIKGKCFTPVGIGLIPTGELREVRGTPLDFVSPRPIGARINTADTQLELAKGYDHNWVLDGAAGVLRLVARVAEPQSGRLLEVETTEPGLQFYSGNFLDGSVRGKAGCRYEQRSGFALETQHFPDSPNHPNFPRTVLRPGELYKTTTVYRFSVGKFD